MDGRVKTLHPAVHGGMLGVRDDPEHVDAMHAHGIEPIDLVVVNLYPFEEVRRSGADYASIVENIDIGGPAMMRASAKNHAYVAVVTDPDDYAAVLNALELNFGCLSLEFRKKLAAKAFARTAAYDAAISGWFAEALEIEHPVWRAFGGRLDKRHALRRKPASGRRLLRHRRQAPGRRDRAASCRASSCPTTTSTTPTPPSNWSPNSTRRRAPPSPSSSMPIRAASRWARR